MSAENKISETPAETNTIATNGATNAAIEQADQAK